MCEILVRAVDGTCQRPEANPLKGFPVCVQPDGHEWGTQERLPSYVVIKIPSATVEQAQQYARIWFAEDGETVLGRRRYIVNHSVVDDAIAAGGTLTLNRGLLTRNMIDRVA